MPSGFPTIRHALSTDYKSIAGIIYRSHTISFAPFASAVWISGRQLDAYRAKWLETLTHPASGSVMYVAVEDEVIVGTVRVSLLDSMEFDAQLSGMHVEPELTGHGIGSLLMKSAINFINEQGYRCVELGVIASNLGARRFYETHGWELASELPDGIEGVPIAIYKLA